MLRYDDPRRASRLTSRAVVTALVPRNAGSELVPIAIELTVESVVWLDEARAPSRANGLPDPMPSDRCRLEGKCMSSGVESDAVESSLRTHGSIFSKGFIPSTLQPSA